MRAFGFLSTPSLWRSLEGEGGMEGQGGSRLGRDREALGWRFISASHHWDFFLMKLYLIGTEELW